MIDEPVDEAGVSAGEVEFEWYPAKAESNRKKHGVSFEEARTIFQDEYVLDYPDTEHSGEEDRYIGIGRSNAGRVLFVNFTIRKMRTRIISARIAESWERRRYEIADRHE